MIKKPHKKKGIGLVELIVAIIIIGIFLGFAAPLYIRTRQKTFDNSARSTLLMLQQAEKNYRLDYGEYVDCVFPGTTSSNSCNDVLSLDMQRKKGWEYDVDATSDGRDFEARTINLAPPGSSNWTIGPDDVEPQPVP